MIKPAAPETPAKSLHTVVGQAERVQDLVDEAAEDLSSVNLALNAELAGHVGAAVADEMIEKSEAVEGKVQEASDELAVMNRALKDEVVERHALEVQLETVTEQGEADRHAALHDRLTGLPNRALFQDRLEHGLAQARRHGWSAKRALPPDPVKKSHVKQSADSFALQRRQPYLSARSFP